MKRNLMKKIISYAFALCALVAIAGTALTSSNVSAQADTIPRTPSDTIPRTPSDTIPRTAGTGNSESFIKNPLKANDINELMVTIVDVAVKLGIVIAFLALIWVGFQFVVAQGDPGKISDAKTHFFYVIIGIAVLLGAKVIVEIIKGTLSPFVDTSLLGR
jgi:Type IV secretion system pilin